MKERVVVQACRADTPSDEVATRVYESIDDAIRDPEKLASAKKVLVKPNFGTQRMDVFRERPTTVVDPDVFEGVSRYLREHTDAEILYGDGMVGIDISKAMEERGYAAIAEKYRMRLVDMHAEPYSEFPVPEPAMFRRYTLSSALNHIDFVVSVAKMKSHHLCGVTLSQKNLFGIPPGPVYGSPRITLHSAIRLPLLLVDLTGLFPPDLCVIDGIIGGNFSEWQGDPVSSGLLLAGTNCVAVDATAARLMHVDPAASRGTSPFISADNHIRVASEHGLGPVNSEEIEVAGDPPDVTLPYSNIVFADKAKIAKTNETRKVHCRNAAHYFDRSDTFADQYAGESLVLHDGEVLLHEPMCDEYLSNFFAAVRERSLDNYEVFTKLVEQDDPELRAPYDIGAG